VKKDIFYVLIPLAMAFAGCAGTMHVTEVTKYKNHHEYKKIALLPATYDREDVAGEMNKINYRVMEPDIRDGHTVVSVGQIKRYLGRHYETLQKNPLDKKLLRRIAHKFRIDAVISCEVTGWQTDIPVPDRAGYFLNKVSLTYTLYDAKKLKPISKISGTNENTDVLSEESVVKKLAKELAEKLIKSL
jgi:hypothetical protein